MRQNIKTVALTAIAAAITALPGMAAAQAWPTKAVRIINPFPAGGGTDAFARPLAAKLTKDLGKNFFIENLGGAGGTLGAGVAARASGDGYTWFMGAVHHTIAETLYRKLSYNLIRDFVPVTVAAYVPNVIVVHPTIPVKSVKELIALAKSRPGEITYSSPGAGNSGHLTAALFDSMAKVKTIHIPYKGTAPAVVAVLSGEAHLTWSSIPTILPHVRSGKVRALGVGNKERLKALPEFPTIAEAGVPGYEGYAWGGMVGPAKMPKDIVARLNKEVVATLNQKDVIDTMLKQGTVPTPSTPEEFTAYMSAELKKWGAVVKMANIRAD